MKKSVMTLVMTGAALGVLSGCKSDEKALPDAKPKINLKTEVVHLQTVSDGLEIPAHVDVDPSKMVHVYAPLSGRLLSLEVQPGQEVRKGQTVAMLQSGEVAAARSDFEKAKIGRDAAFVGDLERHRDGGESRLRVGSRRCLRA
jgi:cobalt-zinc-cadmium efflux system membrane fusion protein